MNEIGQKLKSARVEKGLTLDDLQQTTKIQKRYLIAIEEDNFAALPGTFYVKAFVREYAQTVGLNADDVLAELGDEVGTDQGSNVTSDKSASRMNLREKNKGNELSNGQKLLNYLPTIVIVVVVLAIIGTVFGVSYNNKHDAQKSVNSDVEVSSDVSSTKKAQTSHKKSESSHKSKSKKTAKKSSKARGNKKAKQKLSLTANSGASYTYTLTNAPKNNKISLKVSGGNAWSSVSVDGSQSWQDTLSDDQSHTVNVPQGASRILIQLGNSKATSVKVNGHKFDFLKDNSTLTVRTLNIQVGNGSNGSNSGSNTSSQTGTQGVGNSQGATQSSDASSTNGENQ